MHKFTIHCNWCLCYYLLMVMYQQTYFSQRCILKLTIFYWFYIVPYRTFTVFIVLLVFNQQYRKYNIHGEGSYFRKKNCWHEPNQLQLGCPLLLDPPPRSFHYHPSHQQICLTAYEKKYTEGDQQCYFTSLCIVLQGSQSVDQTGWVIQIIILINRVWDAGGWNTSL